MRFKKVYLLYDITNKVFFVHRDVLFREDIFPFKLTSMTSPPLELFTAPAHMDAYELSELYFSPSTHPENMIHHDAAVEIAHIEEDPLTQIHEQQPSVAQPVSQLASSSRRSTRASHPFGMDE